MQGKRTERTVENIQWFLCNGGHAEWLVRGNKTQVVSPSSVKKNCKTCSALS